MMWINSVNICQFQLAKAAVTSHRTSRRLTAYSINLYSWLLNSLSKYILTLFLSCSLLHFSCPQFFVSILNSLSVLFSPPCLSASVLNSFLPPSLSSPFLMPVSFSRCVLIHNKPCVIALRIPERLAAELSIWLKAGGAEGMWAYGPVALFAV